jgi:hypothetical protein
MFEKTLIPGAKKHLALLGRSGLLQDAYLAGGTGLALQLGHRISMDFDFFTARDFVPRVFASELSQAGEFQAEQTSKGSVIGILGGIRFSLFTYKYPLINAPIEYLSLRVADVRDIAAMKIDAVGSRGTMRDFIDLYFICEAGHELTDLLKFYEKKYGAAGPSVVHLKKSLVFFDDAECDEMPRMIKRIKWPDVKGWFRKEIKKLAI